MKQWILGIPSFFLKEFSKSVSGVAPPDQIKFISIKIIGNANQAGECKSKCGKTAAIAKRRIPCRVEVKINPILYCVI